MKVIKTKENIYLFFSMKELLQFNNNSLKEIRELYKKKYKRIFIYDELDLLYRKEIIRDKIYKDNGVYKKLNGRDCRVVIIQNDVKSDFLNKNHIQGADKSNISYGLYHHDNLVGVMCFVALDDGRYDLTRFAIACGVIVHGGFQKLLKKFLSNYQPKLVISFADLTQSSDQSNIYLNNGFKLDGWLKPNFKLYSSQKNKKYHRFTYGNRFYKYHCDEYNSQEDVYTKLQLNKIWDTGKIRYHLFLDENQKIIYGFIYQIRNKINNKIYIGQTTRNVSKRISEYKKAILYDGFLNQHLGNAFKKYGFDNFEFKIIDSANNETTLNEKEIMWIRNFNSIDKTIGYNIHEGGRNAIPSIETRLKMSIAHIGLKHTPDWISKRIYKKGSEEAKKYGRPKSDEERAYLSEVSPKFWQGKTRDQETRDKISVTKKAAGLLPPNTKKVSKIDSSTGEVISEYPSTTEAARNNPDFSQSSISRKCCGKIQNKGPIHWRFVEN